MSGAFSARSLFRRLLRLMTRRYRSFRSEVANRPPSSWTMGRSSGGITGMTSRIIHSGLLAGIAELFDQLDALQKTLVGLGALVDHLAAQLLGQGVDVDALQERADGLRAHPAVKDIP